MVSMIGQAVDHSRLQEFLSARKDATIIVIEDDVGALAAVVKSLTDSKQHVAHIGMHEHGPSFRTLDECLTYHKFTVPHVEKAIMSL